MLWILAGDCRACAGTEEGPDQVADAVDQQPHFRILQVQWRKQAHHRIRSDVDQQAGRESAHYQVGARAVEFDADHQALAANFVYSGRPGEILCDAFPDGLSDAAGAFDQAFILDDCERGERANAA
jgi:hypothetical protein